jgi:hypothetical protein
MGLIYSLTIPVLLTWMLESDTQKKLKSSIQASFCPFCGKAATKA